MAILRRTFFAPTLSDAIRELAEMDDSDFEMFEHALRADDGLDASPERRGLLAAQMRSSGDAISFLVNAVLFLYSQSRGTTVEERRAMVDDLVEDRIDFEEDDRRDRTVQRLIRLLEDDPSFDRSQRRQRLRQGFHATATSFSSTVDLRPEISDDGRSLVALVPVIQFRIGTDDEDDRHKHLTFHLTQHGILRMREELDAIQDRLALITKSSELKIDIDLK